MLVANFFAGPGCGKSTHASGLFYLLKRDGVNAEYIQEYAKDRTWGKDFNTLLFQPYVTAKQWFRLARLLEPVRTPGGLNIGQQVDIAVTDSPIPTGLLYPGVGCTEHWEEWVWEAFNSFENVNFLLVRNSEYHPYNPKGRSQTEEESAQKDAEIENILRGRGVDYHKIVVGPRSLDEIHAIVLERLNR